MAWFDVDGCRIHYEESGEGPSLLLLPGWGGTIDEFGQLRAALSARFHVIAADLPGSGKSLPQPRAYTAAYCHEDAGRFLRMLDHLDALPAHLVGFSDGGEYALIMGAQQPEAASSIVTWGAAGVAPNAPEIADAMFDLVDDPAPGLEAFAAYMTAAYGDNARPMLQSWAQALKELMASGGDLSLSIAGHISCPVLLITAEHDVFAPPSAVAHLASVIPQADTVVTDGRHALHTERPDWLVDTVVGWLDRHA